MADNGQITYGLDLETQGLDAELRHLVSAVNGVSSDLIQAQNVMARSVQSMTSDLSRQMMAATGDVDKLYAAIRRLDRGRGQVIQAVSQGNLQSQMNRGAGAQIINESKGRVENVEAGIKNAEIANITARLRTQTQVIEARLRQVQYDTDQMVRNAAPGVMDARGLKAERNRSIMMGQMTDPALLNAQDQERERRRNRLVEESDDVDLQDARLLKRREANNKLVMSALDIEDSNAREVISKYQRDARLLNTSPEMIDAKTVRDERSRTRLLSEMSDPDLMAAKDNSREAARTRLIEESRDADLAEARVIERRKANARLIERAMAQSDPELDEAKRARNVRARQELIDAEKDSIDLENKRILRERARIQRGLRANAQEDPEALAAAQSRNDRRRAQMIEEENDLIDLRNREILRERARIQRDATANQDPRLTQARENIRAENDQRTIRRGEVGSVQASHEQRMEFLGANGGANIIAIQAKLIAGYAALNLVMTGISNTAQFVVELDAEFRQFQAITATTNSEMAVLKQQLIEVSEASKFTALEIAEAATAMGQAGLSADEVAKSMSAVSLLATAAGTDLSSAVDIVTSTMGIFNLQTSQTGDIANTLTSALNLSKLTLDQLTLGFQYAGNTAAQMGITYQELTGTLGALANAGIRSGSTLGTGLRQLLIDIQNPTEKFKKALHDLQLTQEDVNIETNGLLPVLNKLKEAGFGSAQAFESFEVRAAAAFAALSNNTDLAAELQQQFLLSTAATEANAIQMESLANTYAKFGSVIGTIAYNAFEPLIIVLQKTLNAVADMLSTLNNVPGLLQILTVALTGLGVAAGASMFAGLVAGLAQAIPLFSSVAVAATGAAGSMGVLGAATATTTGLVGTLFTLIARHPIVLLLGVVAAAAVAITSLGDATVDTTDRIDAMGGRINQLKGDADTAVTEIEAINQTISNLIRQKAALDKDPIMRANKMREVQQAFKEIAGEVDTTKTSVDELIGSLNTLAGVQFTALETQFQQIIDANNEQISLLKIREQETTMNTDNMLQGSIDPLSYLVGEKPSMLPGVGLDPEEFLDYAYNRVFGPEVQNIANIIRNKAELPEDVSDVSALPSTLDAKISGLSADRAEIEARGITRPLTEEEKETLRDIPQQIALLERLKELLAPFVDIRIQQEQLAGDNRIQNLNLIDAKVRATPEFAGVRDEMQSIEDDSSEAMRQAALDTRGQTQEEIAEAFSKVEAAYQARLVALQEEMDAIAQKIVDESDGSITLEDVKGVMQQDQDRLTSLGARISTRTDNENQLFQKFEAERLEREAKTADQQMQTMTRTIGRAKNRDDLNALEEFVRIKMDQRSEILDKIYDAKVGATDDPSEILDLEFERTEAQRQLNLEEQQAMDDIANRRMALQEEVLRQLKQQTDDEIKAISDKLAEVLAEMAKVRPGPAMDALKEKFRLLQQGLDTLQNEANSIDIQSGSLNLGGTREISGKVADPANFAMEFFMGKGMTKNQAAGIVGNLIPESNLRTDAVGDHGTAYGVAQWRGDRQTNLRNFAGGDVKDLGTQLSFILEEFRTTHKTAYDALMQTTTAAEAADVIRKKYEIPSADPRLGQHQARIDYANTLAGVDYSTQAQDAVDLENKEDKVVAASTRKAAVDDANAAIGNSRQQIQTINTQAGISTDPEAIKRMIASVNEQYAIIIDESIKKFEAENVDAAADDVGVATQREDMLKGIRADQNQAVSALLGDVWDAMEDKINEPLENAKAALAAAQTPENASKFTEADILGLESNVRLEERKVAVEQLNAAQQILASTSASLAEAEKSFGAGSAEASYWSQEQANALERVTALQQGKNATDAITAQQGPSVKSAIDSATQAWAMQNGILDETGKMIPLAKQVENSWGQVLDTLSTGFSTLFMDLAKGTMSAGEAFSKFALSVIDGFMQMIAKALAMQVVMALMGDGSKGGGGIGDWIGNLLGVVAPGAAPAANGDYIRGAAVGEIVPGISNRDSVLRKVMPGEMILRRSAVASIGQGALENINNMGATSMSEGTSPALPANDNPAGAGQVNVWVVSPDQVPQMGPNDVIATIADNIQRRGSIKQLIQQVNMGAM